METLAFVAAIFAAISLIYAPAILSTFLYNRKLKSIPAVGPSGTFTSYIGFVHFLRHGRKMLKDGYIKFHGSVFKVPTLTSWTIVVSGSNLIDELRRAPDEILSSTEALRQATHLDLTLGRETYNDPFHAEAIRGPFTKNIGTMFADVQDEIAVAFKEHIPVKGDEWARVTLYSTVMDIVCRASNRMFVGVPLCRDPDWMELNKSLTLELMKGAFVLGLFPATVRPFVAPLLWSISRSVKRGVKHLEPLIKERVEQEKRRGKDSPERPNDLVSWFFDVTKDRPRSVLSLVKAMLVTNFAAIHTTTMSVTYVMYELATRPEYVQPLREEIEAVISEEGWSKESVRKLRKLDSFIKESLRLTDFTVITMWRKALKDFTFSNGITIPAGSTVAVPYNAVHTDPDNYPDPGTFDGFRFEKMREKDSGDAKHQLTSLGIDYVLFGYGRHACPGRFFVVNEVKVMLAHVLLNYDIKMADGRGLPESWQFGFHAAPDMTAKMMFRNRREV
ncbi:hypothetical protein M378DRAFT_168328 [Amanita muscaria Koide BX008]|uniref:Cytochrome P450 n=1 Tax=Amanita muscaria (strain Koide BX008) TaxID=946122 RepID=A0A0C2SBR6_AMAMK|nr:hypothetical protein M378DRAFT_168328 [Amanita muscaria Koide BX008]